MRFKVFRCNKCSSVVFVKVPNQTDYAWEIEQAPRSCNIVFDGAKLEVCVGQYVYIGTTILEDESKWK